MNQIYRSRKSLDYLYLNIYCPFDFCTLKVSLRSHTPCRIYLSEYQIKKLRPFGKVLKLFGVRAFDHNYLSDNYSSLLTQILEYVYPSDTNKK